MKILLNGATVGTNFGDFLFAKIFQNEVAKQVGMDNTYWYESRFAYSDFFKENLQNAKQYKLKQIDGLVYISGGYFCGNDKTWKNYVIRYLSYFAIGFKCIVHRIPYGIFGVEVGRSNSRIIRWVQKKLLRKAKIVTVRNKKSYDFTKSLGVDNVICTADTVFAMDESLFSDTPISDQIVNCPKKLLLLHINPTKEANSVIKARIIPVVNAFLQNHPDYGVVISADQYREGQEIALEDIAQCLQCDLVIKNIYKNPLALCKVIQAVDTVVTTKLHVGIVGAKFSKAVISFSGHTEKISRLYEELGEQERTTALAQLDYQTGVAMLEKFYDVPIYVSDEIVDKAKVNLEQLAVFLQELSGRSSVEG